MDKVRLEIEFVTPCFLGGADATAAPEWNGKAIRGQLRWWFRAVAGGYFAGDLSRVVLSERRIFGDTSRSSSLRVRASRTPAHSQDGKHLAGDRLSASAIASKTGVVRPDQRVLDRLTVTYERHGQKIVTATSPIQYLAYGPFVGKNLERPFICPGETGCLELWFHSAAPVPAEDRRLLRLAITGFFLLGGLGARSRRGFGSLYFSPAPDMVPDWFPRLPRSTAEYEGLIQEILASAVDTASTPEWSHLSRATQVSIALQGCASQKEALLRLGCWLLFFRRRYGNENDARTVGSPTNARPLKKRDYHWVQGQLKSGERRQIPDRAGFSPQLAFTKPHNKRQSWRVYWDNEDGDRRASPLLLHVQKLGNLYYPVLTHVPARLIPHGKQLRFRDAPPCRPTPEQLSIIDDFLEFLSGQKLIQRIAREEAA